MKENQAKWKRISQSEQHSRWPGHRTSNIWSGNNRRVEQTLPKWLFFHCYYFLCCSVWFGFFLFFSINNAIAALINVLFSSPIAILMNSAEEKQKITSEAFVLDLPVSLFHPCIRLWSILARFICKCNMERCSYVYHCTFCYRSFLLRLYVGFGDHHWSSTSRMTRQIAMKWWRKKPTKTKRITGSRFTHRFPMQTQIKFYSHKLYTYLRKVNRKIYILLIFLSFSFHRTVAHPWSRAK